MLGYHPQSSKEKTGYEEQIILKLLAADARLAVDRSVSLYVSIYAGSILRCLPASDLGSAILVFGLA
jgi:hypothetical protein